MAKKAKVSIFSPGAYMKPVTTVIIAALAIATGYWVWNQHSLWDAVHYYVENGEIMTLEARYSPEQLMEANRKDLLIDAMHTYLEPELKFHPYLLMDVKYVENDKRTKEGVVLWSLLDGEMVLNTDTWEKTHGFEDAINAKASASDFRIINALAKNGGTLTKEALQKELHLESETFAPWIESALKKQLIVMKGNQIQLHFQNPKLLVTPQTKINHWIVTKPYEHAQRISRQYSNTQIENAAKAAFGQEFTVRKQHEVFLPVYRIAVQNPDGSILTTYWNALNGQRVTLSAVY